LTPSPETWTGRFALDNTHSTDIIVKHDDMKHYKAGTSNFRLK